MISSAAEAKVQKYLLPEKFDDSWSKVIADIDGYLIASEMGFDLRLWGEEQLKKFNNNEELHQSELELRLFLFYIGRLLHFTGFTYREYDHVVDYILFKLSKIKGTSYTRINNDK